MGEMRDKSVSGPSLRKKADLLPNYPDLAHGIPKLTPETRQCWYEVYTKNAFGYKRLSERERKGER